MRTPEQNIENQQRCDKCGKIVGCNYHGQEHECDCQIESGDICESCKKLGENTCGNDISHRCFEPIIQ